MLWVFFLQKLKKKVPIPKVENIKKYFEACAHFKKEHPLQHWIIFFL
jgi:hypothetical protein